MPSFRDDLSGRFAALGIVIFVALGVLLSRLWFLQVLAGEQYARLAEGNRIREISMQAPRGVVFDRNGKPLVTNRPGLSVSVTPAALADKALIARLARLLGVSRTEIVRRVREKRADPLKPRVIKHDVGVRAVSFIKEHRESFPGVEIEAEAIRDYPNKTLAAHMLGYIGELSDREAMQPRFSSYALGDIVGKTGVERVYEGVLQGVKGARRLEVDASGRPIRILKEEEPVQGRNLHLTIETSIQAATEDALDWAIRQARRTGMRNAYAGAAVVMNVRNGEIAALASRPAYDPAMFLGGISRRNWARLNNKRQHYPLNDRTLMSAYPPGSTFKPITAIAGLETGVTSPVDSFVDSGKWTGMGEDWPKYCWNRGGHGGIGFVEGMAQSCDTVFYEIGLRLYRRRLEELQAWARRFGLGARTGVDLPSEVQGRVPDKAWKKAYNKGNPQMTTWMPGDTVNIAIGQGDVLMTPLQLANVYAAIANGGTLYKPHVMLRVTTPDGRTSHKYRPVAVRRLKTGTAHLSVVRDGLRRVVTEGTAQSVFVDFPLEVSGKTGTAEVAGKDDFAWFVGYAPSSNPQYVAVVMVEQGGHGGSVAAPAVRNIFAALYGLPFTEVEAHDESR